MNKQVLDRIIANTARMQCGYKTPCYVWTGQTSGQNGRGHSYPRMSYKGQTVAVHRLVAKIKCGPIPKGKQVDHLCHNRTCVRPDHLEIVTHKKNQLRRAKEERRRKKAQNVA